MIDILLYSLLLSLGINIAMFLVAYKLQSDKLTDISYAVTFFVLALYATIQSNASLFHIVLLVAVFLWSARLGSFLLYRVHKVGKDSRFDAMRGSFVKFGQFWVLQAVTVWVLMLPIIFASQFTSELSIGVWAGLTVWGLGLLIESLADIQKFTFTQNVANKGKWIESGIWKYSRHPNYFGEILVWTGVYLMVIQALPLHFALIALISPIFISTLLLFVSGIPLLEKAADKRWGGSKGYQQYKRRTSILVPLPNRR